MRISKSRLREVARRAPPPYQQITTVRTVIEPNGPGGCDGPPIPVGVACISRTRRKASSITVGFDEPRHDLLDADWNAMTDDEIAALGVTCD